MTNMTRFFIVLVLSMSIGYAQGQDCETAQDCYRIGQTKGYTEEAVGYFEKALSLWTTDAADPDSKTWILNGLGNTHFTLGNYPKAIQAYNQIIQFNPKNKRYAAEAYMSRGNVMLENDNYQGAINSYTKAMEVRSPYVSVLGNRAVAYKENGQVELGIADLKAAANLGSRQAISILYYKHDVDFRPQQKEALAADEGWQKIKTLEAEARSLVKNKSYTEALNKYEEIENLYGARGDIENNVSAIVQLAYIDRKEGRYQEAVANASRAVYSTYPTALAFVELGYAYYDSGDAVAGVKACSDGLKRFPDNKDIINAQAWMYSSSAGRLYKSGEYLSSYNLYIEAYKIKPTDANALVNAGHAAYAGKYNKQALDAYSRAVEIDAGLAGDLNQYITYLRSVVR